MSANTQILDASHTKSISLKRHQQQMTVVLDLFERRT